MRTAIVVLLGALPVLAGAGCTASATADAYSRSDRLAVARDQYHAQKTQCERLGGSMSLRSRPLEPPGVTEYRSARCVRR
jgi:hypothetical protein